MSPVIKRKRKTFQISGRALLIALSALCVALMAFTFRTDLFEGPLRSLVSKTVIPFQRGISEVGGYLSERSRELARLRDVLAENQELQERIDALTMENSQLLQDRYELNNLRSLLELDRTYSDYDKVGARIIASESGNWFYSFTIDKGERDGIRVDCNVLAGSGLVGRVVSVGPDYAKVQAIISDNHNVSATVLATSENMIVSGDLQSVQTDGTIRFGQLSDPEGRVSAGDKVVTSDISDKYLPGILIGYISSVGTAADNLTRSGSITPAADFSHLEEVLVITELKQQG